MVWPCSRFEERSHDADNKPEQIGHHVASLLRLIPASAPNRIFGIRSPKSNLQRPAKSVTSQLPVSQPVSRASDYFTGDWILLDFFNRFLECGDLLLEQFLATH
jgi:hypothetical protein